MPTPVNWSTDGTLLCEPEPLSLSTPLSLSSCDWLPSTSPFFITSVALPPGTSFWKTSLKFFDTWNSEMCPKVWKTVAFSYWRWGKCGPSRAANSKAVSRPVPVWRWAEWLHTSVTPGHSWAPWWICSHGPTHPDVWWVFPSALRS